ncbi:hypothetical protein L0U85_01660 [Glycomyces sp. L485]|uniref:hypothetical protein n=1 Tax=Glycomyces sp. L485 TaxID=2909235 RepID=UPI001F4A24A5|nr:hypothetical protein [Glycomyces sp. L485]MCH7229574.1 hypothetical protein [Glycomyces sp. L485]
MIAAYLLTCLTGLVSAFLPVTPVEPYLIGLAATTGHGPVGLGIAAALGQTAGKTVFFLGTRGALRSTRLRQWAHAAGRRRHREPAGRIEDSSGEPQDPVSTRSRTAAGARWRGLAEPIGAAAGKLTALLDRPALTVPILFLSAVTGLPPLLATCIYTAYTRISAPAFVLVCLLGRSIRFIAVALAPHLLMG